MTGSVSVDKNGDRQMDISMYRYVTTSAQFVEYSRYNCLSGNISELAQVCLRYVGRSVVSLRSQVT